MNKLEIEAKETYIASVVHDLKNPLIAQKRILEMLIKHNSYENLELKEFYKELLTTSKIMFEMVVSILNTYKYGECEIIYDFQKFNLLDLITEICKELTSLTSEEKELYFSILTELQSVVADRMHIRRVISNLLSNALRYKKDNTKVYIELTFIDGFYRFSVKNYGYYIKPELQKEIFNRYVSKGEKLNSHATGLGLYLSKQIIEGHNGKMFLNSTTDGVNTFGFFIPQSQRKSACS